MQSINYAVYDADLEGGEVYFSQALRDMLGMKPDDPAYTTGNITEAIHPMICRPIARRSSRIFAATRHASRSISAIAPPTEPGAGAASMVSRRAIPTGKPTASLER
jgi:hypothetical protein